MMWFKKLIIVILVCCVSWISLFGESKALANETGFLNTLSLKYPDVDRWVGIDDTRENERLYVLPRNIWDELSANKRNMVQALCVANPQPTGRVEVRVNNWSCAFPRIN